jgi:hypothetical protein
MIKLKPADPDTIFRNVSHTTARGESTTGSEKHQKSFQRTNRVAQTSKLAL